MSQGHDDLEQAALSAVNIGAWAWDIETDRITWSDALHESFGLGALSQPRRLSEVLQLVHPEDRAHFERELERARRTGSPLDLTHRVQMAGRERWLRARGRLLRDARDAAPRMLGIIEDVSLAHALNAERNVLMQTALDASLFAVVVLDTQGRIIYCNELAAELLGLTRSAAQARAYDAPQFKHTDLDGGLWSDDNQPFVRVMKTGAAVHGVEHCIERPDGRIIALRINAAPVRDDHGEIQWVVCSFEDISERRRVDAALRQSQKMEAVGRLAGGVAHDFNNLLTAILSYAALARAELDGAGSILECLDGIAEAGERAAQLTRQLLAFARREVGQPMSFDARGEVKATARLISRVVAAHVTLELTMDARPCFIRMDPGQLQQVLMNLAINASDAMPEGGKIHLSVQRTDQGSVLLRMADTGHGMDQDTLHKAFEPFFTTKPAHEGTGLGLSMCHGIIVQAGGHISLSSEVGRGTRVDIELPLAAASDSEPATRKVSSAEAVRGARILVIEDDPAVQRIAVHTLERAGYCVRGASHAAQALEILASEPIDLIVCDLVLPGMNGPDLIDHVRAAHPDLPVIFVSGQSHELARTGIEPFLSKPYTPSALRQRIAETLHTTR